MKNNGRIPKTYPLFDKYIKSTTTFLWSDDPDNPGHKQYERLGLTLAEAQDWQGRGKEWTVDLFPKYSDPDQKTITIIHECMDFKKSFALYGHPVISRIAANPAATQQDATIFNFKLTRKDPERRTTPIKEQIFASIVRTGSAEYVAGCRTSTDTKRPSLPPDADSVIISSMITDKQPADPATVDPEGEGFRQRQVSKARFPLKGGSANKGKYLVIAFRWNDSKNPELAGAWSEVQTILIA